ncbi:MAG: GGDEF domain-containing protein [Bradyrhizobium sp.]|nr:GGDEF domain-containing protein [Bradyrhizobium sp.]
MDGPIDRRALDEPVHSQGSRSNAESWDPWTDNPRNARLSRQFRWLVTIAVANLSILAIDLHSLSDSFSTAVSLRLLVITPLVLLALGINRWSSNHRLQTVASACATVSLVATTAIIGQMAQEPFASRYLMAGQFIIFAAAVFAALPWRATQIMTVVSTAVYALVVASALQFPPRMVNLDLVGSNILIAILALYVRREKDARMNEILRMRRIDARRTDELRNANARLTQLSSTDALTGAFNRRYLEVFADNWSTSVVPSLSSGVLMIDVDHFKLFNDLSGHAEGDRCLQRVAGAIRSALRSPDDIVVRYGGEEFVVILPAADPFEALAVAERLRSAVSDLQIPHPGLVTHAVVTVSIGTCVAGPDENITDTIERADKLMYAAKKGGRNRVSA